ncbi:hypothetical protein, partial [Bifidobacterium apri]
MSEARQTSAQNPTQAHARPETPDQKPAQAAALSEKPAQKPIQTPASQSTVRQHPRLLPLPTRIRRAMSGSWAMLVSTLILLATAVIGLIPSFNSGALKQNIVLGA